MRVLYALTARVLKPQIYRETTLRLIPPLLPFPMLHHVRRHHLQHPSGRQLLAIPHHHQLLHITHTTRQARMLSIMQTDYQHLKALVVGQRDRHPRGHSVRRHRMAPLRRLSVRHRSARERSTNLESVFIDTVGAPLNSYMSHYSPLLWRRYMSKSLKAARVQSRKLLLLSRP